MKRILRPLAFGVAALGISAFILHAAEPTYVTKSGNGDATAGASVIFPSSPREQIRLVSLNWNSDSNAAVASITSGVTAYYASVTNAATTSTTNQIDRTNDLVAGSVLVVEHDGVPYAATMSSFNSNATWGNYVVLASGGWGVLTSTNDPIFQMGNTAVLPIGATTNTMQGVAIYSGYGGRPVRIQITPSAVTNKINAAIAAYQ